MSSRFSIVSFVATSSLPYQVAAMTLEEIHPFIIPTLHSILEGSAIHLSVASAFSPPDPDILSKYQVLHILLYL